RAAAGVVHEEERRGGLLIVTGPDTFAAPGFGVIQHAVAEDGAIAEDVDHDGHAFATGVVKAGTDATACAQITLLAGGAVTRVIVVSAHGDGAGTGITFYHQLHHRGGLPEFAIAIKFSSAEDPGGTDNIRVSFGVDIRWITKPVCQVRAFYITAAHHLLQHFIAGDTGTRIHIAQFALADSIDGFHHRHRVLLAEQADQIAHVYQPGNIAGVVHLGGPNFRVDHGSRRHGVATGVPRAGADQSEQ